MEQVLGGYTAVELRNGKMGNYKLAQQYYRDFDRLRIDSPEKFNRICHSVLGENRTWCEEDRQILSIPGLAFAVAAEGGTKLRRPEQEIREFIKLAAAPTIVSRIFGIVTGSYPEYDLKSPFKVCEFGEPDIVPEQFHQAVVLDWEGKDARDYPGSKLVPDPEAKPPRNSAFDYPPPFMF